MEYFTPLHWLALAILALLYIILAILMVRNTEKSSLLATFLVLLLILGFTFLALDNYTKTAKLENVTHQKILINETFSITGQIRNIGKFAIGTCVLEVKITQDLQEKILEGSMFKPNSGIKNLFKWNSSQKEPQIATKKKFVIAKNLKPREIRSFLVSMPYPPTLTKPYIRNVLSCY